MPLKPHYAFRCVAPNRFHVEASGQAQVINGASLILLASDIHCRKMRLEPFDHRAAIERAHTRPLHSINGRPC